MPNHLSTNYPIKRSQPSSNKIQYNSNTSFKNYKLSYLFLYYTKVIYINNSMYLFGYDRCLNQAFKKQKLVYKCETRLISIWDYSYGNRAGQKPVAAGELSSIIHINITLKKHKRVWYFSLMNFVQDHTIISCKIWYSFFVTSVFGLQVNL